jgi:hypothetical protein
MMLCGGGVSLLIGVGGGAAVSPAGRPVATHDQVEANFFCWDCGDTLQRSRLDRTIAATGRIGASRAGFLRRQGVSSHLPLPLQFFRGEDLARNLAVM